MSELTRRQFVVSAAMIAGLTVVPVTIGGVATAIKWHDFYVANWSASKVKPTIEFVTMAFQRAMRDRGYTRMRNAEYTVDYHINRIAYFHVFRAELS